MYLGINNFNSKISAGSASGIDVNGGNLNIISGGFAEQVEVRAGGRQTIFSYGSAEDVTVSDRGMLSVRDYGEVSGLSVTSGGLAYVLTLGEARDIDIQDGGSLYVAMAGTAENLTVAGSVHAATGGAVKNVTVEETGTLYLYGGAILDGVINVSGTVILDDVTHNQGTLNFLVGGASSDQAMLNDYGLLIGRDMCVTVDTSESDQGSYVLAGGAAGFSETMTIYDPQGEELCTLSCGTSQQVGNYRYALSEQDGDLMFSYQDTAVIMITDGDLNGDGRADVIMSITEPGHGAEGATGAWLIQEDQKAAWGDLSTRNPGWEIFGTGRTATGKNTDDIYIRSTGNVVGAWTTSDNGKVNGWETIGEFSADTQIVGLGDFNGNGQTDLLLRNTNGAVGCFFTSNEKHGWNYFQSLGDEWKLSAVGDLNGDGRDDVVLKHDAGFAGSWLTQADGTMAWADLDTLPTGFEIVGAGDFNADGTDDVLLKSGNYYGAWLVNNGNAAGWMGLGDLGDVTVEQIADFNGDGTDDLRIRTAAGDIGTQLVMGADDLVWKYYGSVGAEWSTSLAALA